MEWAPVLDGALADRAWNVVRTIASELAILDEPAADLALFWAYASAALEDEPSAKHASDAIVRFGTRLGHTHGIELFGGLAGAGWIAAHLADDAGDALAAIDRRFVALLDAPWLGPYDLVGGLAGVATYFLAREDDAALARIVDVFADLATRTPAGTTWRSRLEWVGPYARATYPEGPLDCGLAHGVAGVIAVLTSIAERGNAKAAKLRDDALAWLDAQRLPAGGFPSFAGDGPTRAAWCYGDPGVALALWRAGRRDDPVVRAWLARENHGTVDAALCHGTVGLAHIANRMFHASGDPRFRDAARTWYARTLDHYRPGTGIGGFTMYFDGPAAILRMLDGTIGVGLALISAIAPIEPAWDALLACDLR